MANSIYTIGHSTLEQDAFLRLLQMHSVVAVADVRSSPFSRMFPRFNREPLRAFLRQADIQYVFMGDCLGGRPDDAGCYSADGQVEYEKVALLAAFQQGLDRVVQGAEDFRISLMCSEKDPITCHRMLLVARHLAKRHVDVQHILSDGSLESQADAERRMMKVNKIQEVDLFESRETMLSRAYTLQSQACAFTIKAAAPDESLAVGSF